VIWNVVRRQTDIGRNGAQAVRSSVAAKLGAFRGRNAQLIKAANEI
jgi:hypothetical protein